MSDINTELTRKFEEYRSFFVGRAEPLVIPGKLDLEDLLQECLIYMAELMESRPHLDIDGEEFIKIIRHCSHNRMIDRNRYWRAAIRDYRKDLRVDLDPSFNRSSYTEVDKLVQEDTLERLVSDIEQHLSGETLQLWVLFRDDPTSLCDSLEEYNVAERQYWDGLRCPKINCSTPNQAVMAYHLNNEILSGELVFKGDRVRVDGFEGTCKVLEVDAVGDQVTVLTGGREYIVAVGLLRRAWTAKKVRTHIQKIRKATVAALGLGAVEVSLQSELNLEGNYAPLKKSNRYCSTK